MQRVRGVSLTLPGVADRVRSVPSGVRLALGYALALGALLLLAQLSLLASRVPMRITLDATTARFQLDGSSVAAPLPMRPSAVQFVRPANTVREFQIDGTDSVNNFTQDPAYFARLASSPYYAFQAWMRADGSYSSWHDVAAEGFVEGSVGVRPIGQTTLRDGDVALSLPPGSQVVITGTFERLEVPVHVQVICGSAPCADLEIDRNDRFLRAQPLGGDPNASAKSVYFPQQPLPWIAEVLYLVFEVGFWSLVVCGAATLLTTIAALLTSIEAVNRAGVVVAQRVARQVAVVARAGRERAERITSRWSERVSRLPGDRWDGWDALAAGIMLASLAWLLFISRVLFAGQPHVLDASSYYFQAKIFASGQLSAPAPLLPDAFKGPFMIVGDGRWFGIYPPATCALLALGILIHLPWAVEPLLGSLALWGIYRIGRLLFDVRVGLLALLLGALSPFYTFLAATYMSHAVALFFAVYFLLTLLRFTRTHAVADLVLAALCAGGLMLTRELSAAIIITLGLGYIAAVGWRELWADRERVMLAVLAALPTFFLMVLLDLTYNLVQTGDPTLSPRLLFDPTAQYGFGHGIGFYGQHTLAAGFVNLEQLLTTLLIDLYGWPFYLTLAFLLLTFLRRSPWRGQRRWDLFCVGMFAALALSQVGYFYHGIYLGPRYLYETLPFLLLLSARGILALPELAGHAAVALLGTLRRTWSGRAISAVARGASVALLCALVLCNLLYYLPRQVQLANGDTGLPYYKPVDTAALYAFHRDHTIVLTSDWFIYSTILFPLNDPDLRGPTLYAYMGADDTASALHKLYPDRTLYWLQVDAQGHATFTPLDSASGA